MLLLLGVLVVVATAAAAWVLTDDSPQAPGESTVFTADPVVPAPTMALTPAEPSTAQPTALAVPDGGGFADSDGPVLQVPSGTPTGIIQGKVVDSANQPVGGVQLSVYKGNALSSINFAGTRQVVSGVTSTSAPDGGFELVGIPRDKDYVVVGEHPEYARSETARLPVHPKRPTTGVVLRMEPGATVSGIVLTSTGSPIAEARVSLFDATIGMLNQERKEPRPWKVVFTEGTGEFTIDHVAAPSFRVRVEAQGYEAQTRLVSFALQDKPQDTALDFHLNPGRDLPGRVVDTRGAPIREARIEVTSLTKDYQGNAVAFSDGDGYFMLEGLGEHYYQLRATCDGFSNLVQPKVHVDDNELLLEMEPRLSVDGFVTDSRGQPVTEFSLTLMRAAKGRDPMLMSDTRPYRSAEGYFVFDNLDPGSYALEARAGKLAPQPSESFTLARGDPRPQLRIVLSAGGTLRGTVLDSNGKPVHGAVVKVNPNNHLDSPVLGIFSALSAVSERNISARTGKDGSYLISNITPGTYQIEVKHPDSAPRAIDDVVIVDDEFSTNPPFDVTLPAGAVIAGRAMDHNRQLLPFTEVQLSTKQGYVETVTTDRDGVFGFQNLPEGSYTVMVKPTRIGDQAINPLVRLMYAQRSSKDFFVGEGQKLNDVELYLPDVPR